MATTKASGFSKPGTPGQHDLTEKHAHDLDSTPIARGIEDEESTMPYSPRDSDELKPVYDSTHRKLKPRHIQLIGIGG
jgi:amino acid permease